MQNKGEIALWYIWKQTRVTQVCNLISIPGRSETFTGLAQDSECVKVVVPVVNCESREQITGGGNVSGTCLRGTCRKDGFLSVDKVSRATVENESCSARTCAPQVDPTVSMFTSACQSSRPLWVTKLSSPAPLILPSNLNLLLSEPSVSPSHLSPPSYPCRSQQTPSLNH